MKICVAQTNPVKGNILLNLKQHINFIHSAGENDVDIIIFPELSLTGYEPELAHELAVSADEIQFNQLQTLSNEYQMIIGVGMPTKSLDLKSQILISMIIFKPDQAYEIYSKQYLFETEKEIFIAGKQPAYLSVNDEIVAPSICYELSNPNHSACAKQNNASVYLASVLNSLSGIEMDLITLSNIAQNHEMTVAMANYIGQSGGYQCAGRSSIWNDQGQLVGQLDGESEGLLIYDTKTEQLLKKIID